MAKAKMITSANLGEAISVILSDYEGTVKENLEEVTKKVAKAGVQALKNESFAKFKDVGLPNGRYGTGWTSKIEKTRIGCKAILYNKKYPGLPHLLEFGHAKRGGGRVEGRPHIAPVVAMIDETFVTEAEREVSG